LPSLATDHPPPRPPGPPRRPHHAPHHHEHATALRSLFAVGVSGGVLPCPSALVVLLAAISLHRVAFGLALIVAFSAGLALSITGVGLIAVLAKRVFGRLNFEGRAVSLLPAVSALVIVVAGLAMTLRAVPKLGSGAGSGGRSAAGDDRQAREPAHAAGAVPPHRASGSRRELADSLAEELEHHRQLEPGDVRTETDVRAVAEGDVPVR